MNATPVFPISFVLPVVLAVLIICALALQPGKAAATEPDSTPPSISSISVTSDPKDDVGLTIPYRVLSQGKGYKRFPIYAVGDTIQLTVAFDKTINVTGTPQLEFAMGSSIKEASFTSIDGNSLIFEYPVVNGDKDTDGISVKANSLLLNGGTIQSESGTSANLSHDALPAQRGHKVDGIPPTVKTLWIQDGEPVPIEVLGIGDQVIVGIHFSEQVYSSIQGPPQIRLQVGDAERAASFQSEGWGKSFVYFIQEGDLDPDGLSVKANSIDLNGGFIKDRAGNPLVLSNPAKNYGSKRIRTNEDGSIEVMGPVDVDGIRPVVDSLAIISDPGNDKTYEAGDVVKVSVNFSEPMTVPETGGVWHGKRFTSVPSLFLNIGGTERRAWFENVDGNSVIFAYTIQDDDQDSDGISIGANKLTVKHEDKELQHPLIVALIRDRPDTKVGVNDADLTHSALADNPSHLVGEASEQQKQRTPTNQPPTVSGTLADVTIVNESGTKRVSLSGVFSDTDADALTITAASSDEAKATVSVAGDYSTLTVTAKARGTATVTVTAADGNGGTVDDSFTVKVKAAPVVAQPLGDVIDLEPEETHTVSMSGVFSDADGDAVTVTEASSSDTSIAAVSAAIDGATSAITAITVTANSEGTATITVTARDADGNTVQDAFDVTVNAPAAQQQKVNNPPTVSSAIADATIANEGGTHGVSLSGVFDDADGDDLTVTASSSDENTATVSVSADYSTLTVTAQARGTATITVTAADGNGGSVEDSFTVRVKAAPVVAAPIADVSELDIDATHEVSMSGVFSDPDGDTVTVTQASSSDTSIAAVSAAIDGATAAITAVTVTANSEGTATITVTARDSDGNTVQDAFDVTVNAPAAQQQQVNHPPTVSSTIPDATIASESGTHGVSLSGVFDDADGDDLTVTASSSDENTATVSVAADYSTLTVSAQARGTATVTVTAADGYGGSVEDSFTVRVKAAPVVASAIADISGLEVDATQDISLSGVFSDPDGDALTVTAASDDDAKATVSLSGDYSKLTVTGVAGGTATITVTAEDADGNRVSDAFDVTVIEDTDSQFHEGEPVPGPVTGLQLTAEGVSLIVSWGAPAPDSGGEARGYIVHLKPEDGGKGRTKTPKAKKARVSFDNLEAGRTYRVWVRAQNEAGKGERVHATITLPEAEPAQQDQGDQGEQGDGQQQDGQSGQ